MVNVDGCNWIAFITLQSDWLGWMSPKWSILCQSIKLKSCRLMRDQKAVVHCTVLAWVMWRVCMYVDDADNCHVSVGGWHTYPGSSGSLSWQLAWCLRHSSGLPCLLQPTLHSFLSNGISLHVSCFIYTWSCSYIILDVLVRTLFFFNKKLSYRRGTARCTMSVEILSTAVQLYKKSHWKSLVVQ